MKEEKKDFSNPNGLVIDRKTGEVKPIYKEGTAEEEKELFDGITQEIRIWKMINKKGSN